MDEDVDEKQTIVRCPDCGAKLKMRTAPGKKIRCPKCETVFAPESDDRDSDPPREAVRSKPKRRPEPEDEDDEDREDEDDRPSRRKPRKRRKGSGGAVLKWLLLAGGGGMTIGLVTVLMALELVRSYGMALFVGSASLVILRTGVIWRWLAGLGLLAALLLVIGAAWPIDGDEEGAIAILGFIGAPATMLFIIISSINMIIRSEEPAPTERASAA